MTLLRAGILWHVFKLSHSPFQLGLVGIAQFLPAASLMLLAGALADTRDRRRIMRFAESVAMTGGSLLAAATLHGSVTLPLLYGVVVLVAAATAFDNPARAALLPTLVSRKALPRALTIASTNQALAFATGPALGGLLIAEFGIGALYVGYVVLMAGALTGLALIPRGSQQPGTTRVSLQTVREGLSFVRRQPVVLGCMLLDMLAVIFGGATALLPVYANDILGVGARGYGLLTASLDLGALLSAAVLTVLPPIRRAGPTLLAAVGVYALATIAFGLSRWFPLSVAAYMLVGVADQVSVVLRATAIQLSTPDALRGRVSAVNLLFIGASNQLGAAESGFVAALTSAEFAVVSGGVVSLLMVLVIAWALPPLHRYRTAP